MAIVKVKRIRNTPLLYEEIMKGMVAQGKCENVNHFVNEAIKQKLEAEYGSLEPQEIRNVEGWINDKWSGTFEEMTL